MPKKLLQAVSITFSLYLLMGLTSDPTVPTVSATHLHQSVPQLGALYRIAKTTSFKRVE